MHTKKKRNHSYLPINKKTKKKNVIPKNSRLLLPSKESPIFFLFALFQKFEILILLEILLFNLANILLLLRHETTISRKDEQMSTRITVVTRNKFDPPPRNFRGSTFQKYRKTQAKIYPFFAWVL